MNTADSEIVKSILLSNGHVYCDDLLSSDLILTNTCAIRGTFVLPSLQVICNIIQRTLKQRYGVGFNIFNPSEQRIRF